MPKHNSCHKGRLLVTAEVRGPCSLRPPAIGGGSQVLLAAGVLGRHSGVPAQPGHRQADRAAALRRRPPPLFPLPAPPGRPRPRPRAPRPGRRPRGRLPHHHPGRPARRGPAHQHRTPTPPRPATTRQREPPLGLNGGLARDRPHCCRQHSDLAPARSEGDAGEVCDAMSGGQYVCRDAALPMVKGYWP